MNDPVAGAVNFPSSILEDLRRIGSILWKPSDVFGELRDHPRYLLPLVVVTLGGVLLDLEARPLIEQLVLRSAPTDLSMDQLERGLAYFQKAELIGMFVSPIVLLMKWSCTAYLLYLTSTIVGAMLTYRQTLSLVSFSSVILLLESYYSRLVVHVRGLDFLTSPRDLDPPIGLSLLKLNIGPGWYTFLNTFNLFEFWFVTLLVLGLTKLAGFSKKRAFLAVFPVWLLLSGVRAGIAALAGGG